MSDYMAACEAAATDQGLDPAIDALRAAGIGSELAQTGGMCMAIAIPAYDAYPHVLITAGDVWNDDETAPTTYVIGAYANEDSDCADISDHAAVSDLAAMVAGWQDKGVTVGSTVTLEVWSGSGFSEVRGTVADLDVNDGEPVVILTEDNANTYRLADVVAMEHDD